MTVETKTTRKVAIVATMLMFGLVGLSGCQTTQEKADAIADRTPATTTTPAPAPATAPRPVPGPGPAATTSTSPKVTTPTSEWPKMVTIPAGTSMIVALQSRLRTDGNEAGDSFRTNLIDAIRVDQMTVLPAGTEVRGQLTLVEEPHRTTGKAQMTLALRELIDPSGDLRSFSAVPIVLVAEGDKISDEAKVASGAVIGGVIGALSSSKQRTKGAAVGAAAGAVAGGALALATKGNQLDLPAGQRFEFELDQSLTLPVTRLTSQLQGNSPTPNYAALHPKASLYDANQASSTAAANRTSEALARDQAADAAALVRQQTADAKALATKQAADAAAKTVWPKILTVPVGTTLVMALQTHLRTDSNVTGDTFRANLTDAVRVDNMTVFPVGTEVRGRLSLVEEPHRTSGKAQMTLTFLQVVDPAGFLHAITSDPLVLVGEGDKVSDEAKVGAGAVIGGIIGALTSKKQRTKGAAVGAAAGAAAGGAVALATKGKQIDLPAGQRFEVELQEVMRVSVTQLNASR